jgi:hypothetical protein
MNYGALGKEQRPVELRHQEGVAPNVGHQAHPKSFSRLRLWNQAPTFFNPAQQSTIKNSETAICRSCAAASRPVAEMR